MRLYRLHTSHCSAKGKFNHKLRDNEHQSNAKILSGTFGSCNWEKTVHN